MQEDENFIIIESKLAPEIFIKTLEVKKLLDRAEFSTIQEACAHVGMSRSAYYKYKDSVFSFKEDKRGRTVIVSILFHDKKGLMSDMLNIIAKFGWNIRSLNATQSVNSTAHVAITMDNIDGNTLGVTGELEKMSGVISLKIIARE